MNQLAPSRPVKFTAVPPGSRIRITDATRPMEPWEALAIDVIPEYGPNRIPAIVTMMEGASDTEIVTATGKFTVEIVSNSASLRELAGAVKGGLRARTIPIEVRAIRFDGSTDSARDCIIFAAGAGAVRFDPNATPPQLVIVDATPTPVPPGSYLVVPEQGKLTAVDAATFAEKYEVHS